jgi:hypothetical protein
MMQSCASAAKLRAAGPFSRPECLSLKLRVYFLTSPKRIFGHGTPIHGELHEVGLRRSRRGCGVSNRPTGTNSLRNLIFRCELRRGLVKPRLSKVGVDEITGKGDAPSALA